MQRQSFHSNGCRESLVDGRGSIEDKARTPTPTGGGRHVAQVRFAGVQRSAPSRTVELGAGRTELGSTSSMCRPRQLRGHWYDRSPVRYRWRRAGFRRLFLSIWKVRVGALKELREVFRIVRAAREGCEPDRRPSMARAQIQAEPK